MKLSYKPRSLSSNRTLTYIVAHVAYIRRSRNQGMHYAAPNVLVQLQEGPFACILLYMLYKLTFFFNSTTNYFMIMDRLLRTSTGCGAGKTIRIRAKLPYIARRTDGDHEPIRWTDDLVARSRWTTSRPTGYSGNLWVRLRTYSIGCHSTDI